MWESQLLPTLSTRCTGRSASVYRLIPSTGTVWNTHTFLSVIFQLVFLEEGLFSFSFCVWMMFFSYVCLCTMCRNVHGGQKKSSGTRDLELQTFVSLQVVLGFEPGSSVRAASALYLWATAPVTQFLLSVLPWGWTQGLFHIRHMFYDWAISSAPVICYFNRFPALWQKAFFAIWIKHCFNLVA